MQKHIQALEFGLDAHPVENLEDKFSDVEVAGIKYELLQEHHLLELFDLVEHHEHSESGCLGQ